MIVYHWTTVSDHVDIYHFVYLILYLLPCHSPFSFQKVLNNLFILSNICLCRDYHKKLGADTTASYTDLWTKTHMTSAARNVFFQPPY